MSSIKEALLVLANSLPENCTWDDVMDWIYIRQKIEAGIADADAGSLIPHDEVFADLD